MQDLLCIFTAFLFIFMHCRELLTVVVKTLKLHLRTDESKTLFRQLKVREVDGWCSLTNRFLDKEKKRHWTLLNDVINLAGKVIHLDSWSLFKLGEFIGRRKPGRTNIQNKPLQND